MALNFKSWKLADCEVTVAREIKVGDFIALKWNFNKPDLLDVRFYNVIDQHRGWLFLQTKEGEEYVNRIHPDKQVLIVEAL